MPMGSRSGKPPFPEYHSGFRDQRAGRQADGNAGHESPSLCTISLLLVSAGNKRNESFDTPHSLERIAMARRGGK